MTLKDFLSPEAQARLAQVPALYVGRHRDSTMDGWLMGQMRDALVKDCPGYPEYVARHGAGVAK